MNRKDAKQIAEKITNDELLLMFESAKKNITNWEKNSLVNKGITKGTAWNILAKDFDLNYKYHILTKINMIREFGDYLPDYLKIKKIKKQNNIKPIHQEPIF